MRRNYSGTSIVENLVIIGLVALASIAILTSLGGSASEMLSKTNIKVKKFDPFNAKGVEIASNDNYEINLTNNKELILTIDGETTTLTKEDTEALLNLYKTLNTDTTIAEETTTTEETTTSPETESESAYIFNINGKKIPIPKSIVDNAKKILTPDKIIASSPVIKAIGIKIEDETINITPEVIDAIDKASETTTEETTTEETPTEETTTEETTTEETTTEEPPSENINIDGSYTIDISEIGVPITIPIPITEYPPYYYPPIYIDDPVIPPTGELPEVINDDGTISIVFMGKVIVLSKNIYDKLNQVFPTIGADYD
ncbi:MAG: hypothetical protein AB7V50_04485 [Vampirovibrionia bacterium]